MDYQIDSQNRHVISVTIFDSKNIGRVFNAQPNLRKKQGEFEACCKAILFLKDFIKGSVYEIVCYINLFLLFNYLIIILFIFYSLINR